MLPTPLHGNSFLVPVLYSISFNRVALAQACMRTASTGSSNLPSVTKLQFVPLASKQT